MSAREPLPVLGADTGAGALAAVCAHLRERAADVHAEWSRIAWETGDWTFPSAQAVASLPATVAAVALSVEGGCDQEEGESGEMTRLVEEAAARGKSLRAAGVRREAVLSPHFLLREALWRTVQRAIDPAADAQAVMAALDGPLALAAAAALEAYDAAGDG
ncbi:MAG TPA: hypothetical protein VFQ39_16490 [Longimicrobium sp.]|nr:hypothetical protein [Longimicrobium sp.]